MEWIRLKSAVNNAYFLNGVFISVVFLWSLAGIINLAYWGKYNAINNYYLLYMSLYAIGLYIAVFKQHDIEYAKKAFMHLLTPFRCILVFSVLWYNIDSNPLPGLFLNWANVYIFIMADAINFSYFILHDRGMRQGETKLNSYGAFEAGEIKISIRSFFYEVVDLSWRYFVGFVVLIYGVVIFVERAGMSFSGLKSLADCSLLQILKFPLDDLSLGIWKSLSLTILIFFTIRYAITLLAYVNGLDLDKFKIASLSGVKLAFLIALGIMLSSLSTIDSFNTMRNFEDTLIQKVRSDLRLAK